MESGLPIFWRKNPCFFSFIFRRPQEMTQPSDSGKTDLSGHADKPCSSRLSTKLSGVCSQLPEDIQENNEETNYRNGILHRLNEDDLLQVIGYLDGCSVECLRRTARLFFRLCPVVFPDRYVHRVDKHRLVPQPADWPTIRSDGLLKDLLQQDMFCIGCRQARQSNDWPHRVHQTKRLKKCFRCLKSHPACLFSKHQRYLPESSYPHCIAHEGFVRLCEHKVLKQEDLLNTQGMQYSVLAQCLHPTHTMPDNNATGTHDRNANYARAMLVGDWLREEQFLILSWQQHLTRPVHEPLSASELDRPATQAHTQANPGPILQRLAQVGKWFGSIGVKESNTDNISELNPCATGTDRSLSQAGKHGSFSWWGGMEHLRYLNQQQNGHRFQMSCFRSRCPFDEEHCEVTTCQRKLHVSFFLKASLGWYQALDPDSYNLRHDTDGFNVYWCDQEGCKNYYMSSLSRMLKKDEYDHPLETRISTGS